MDATVLKKRFWSDVSVGSVEGGFAVFLDDKPLRTPAKAHFVVPTASLSQAVADEWSQLDDQIDPTRLPFTKLSNAAIDNMAEKAGSVVEALAEYAETDLLCYRADSPEGLVMRQTAAWDPILDWIRDTYGLVMVQTTGILPVEQPKVAIDCFLNWLGDMDDFRLMAVHDLIMLSGSIIIARAVVEDHLTSEQGWEASIVDDIWQADAWGEDEEALALRSAKAQDFAIAARMMKYLNPVK